MTRTKQSRTSAIKSAAARPFWSNFSRLYWEKKPVAFKSSRSPQKSDVAFPNVTAIDSKEIFNLLVKYCDRCRKRDSVDGIKFYVNSVRLESFEAIEHLPVTTDLSLEGYNRRISAEFSDYGLVCDELMQVLPSSDVKREVLGRFVRGLYEFTGIPNRFSEMGLYLGNYKRTPFGVHIDPCSVFSIPVVGRKTFRLWDPAFVAKHPELKEAFSYEEFKKNSVVLSASPGDLAYWPSTYWHIAESDGSFTCTWSIGIWVDRPLSEVTVEALTPLIEKSLGTKGTCTSLRSGSSGKASSKTLRENLPAELKQAAVVISKLSKSQIEKVLEKWWRDHANRDGFKS